MATIRTIKGSEMLAGLNYKPYSWGQRVVTDNTFIAATAHGQTLYFNADKLAVEDFESSEVTLFIVTKNADFTEGRGPMVYHKAFRTFDDAVEYVMKQDGIYGSAQGARNNAGISITGTPYVVSSFNGYNILPDRLH